MANAEGKTVKHPNTLCLRLGPLKQRLVNQCNRLNISQTACINQALTKWLEEEEQIQARVERR